MIFPKKILVVDDDFADRLAVKRHMERPGMDTTVQEAATAKDALNLMKSESYDCVFLDYQLPDMDGISVLRKLYDPDSNLAPFPIVMLTSQSSESVMIDAIRYGSLDYLIKDNITTDTLIIAMTKARQIFELKKDRAQAEEKLIQAQKMEALGQLTGGISHDFNNLLTIIFGHTRLLALNLKNGEGDFDDHLKKIDMIEKAAGRGADLIKRLMLFSQQRHGNPVIVNINDVVTEMEDMLKRTLGEMVKIHLSLGEGISNMNIDLLMLEHAIINVAANARDAMFDGGTLEIKTEMEDVESSNIILSSASNLKAGPYVKITFSDTGTGMDEDVKRRIFEPFFTTKDAGKGTGLGLSTVYGFIRDSGGAFHVESTKGEGTKFSIFLPAVEEVSQPVSLPQESVEEEAGGQETILLVEDEKEILTLTSHILEAQGYKVIKAEDGDKALEILMSNAETIDLLFTDVAMPGELNGVQLAARAEVVKPGIVFLFTTGYAGGTIPDIELARKYPVIDKPYQAPELLQKIRELLEKGGNSASSSSTSLPVSAS